MPPKTPAEVKKEFVAQGKTITEWANENKFPPNAVIRVLNGYSRMKTGAGHAIGVKLGLKVKEGTTQL